MIDALRRRRATTDDCQTLLKRGPKPLYSEELDIAVLWSAKAGCTLAIKWLYFQEGILGEALAYDAWPHAYREEVYYKRASYDEKLERIPDLGERAIKFVRDPYDRAVSSYLHLVRQASRPESTHPDALTALGTHLGRPVGRGGTFTFREFVGFLATLDLDDTDIHLRRQTHGCERMGALPDLTLVKVEEASERLPELEQRFDLRPSDYRHLRRSQHHSARQAGAAFAGNTRFVETLGVPIPATAAFYDDELAAQVSTLYAVDIDRYGYETRA